MQRIRSTTAFFWPPTPGEKFAAFDALVSRGLLFLVIWRLAGWFPGEAPRIRALGGVLWGLDALLWATRQRLPHARETLALANALWWILLVSMSGSGRSPFLLGFFLEIGLAALRLSAAGCAILTLAGAFGLAIVAWQDPTSAGARLAITCSVSVLVTGTAFVWMLRRLAMAPDLATEKLRAAYVAHGIKNSLHGVAGFAELLDTDLPPGDPRHSLTQHIRAGVEEARSRLGELMAPVGVAPAWDGGEQVELRAAVERVLETCRGLLGRANVRACNCIPPSLEVSMPSRALDTILANVVQNALQAMESGGGTLSIEARDHPLRFVVRDTGPGIPAEIRDRVFQPGFTTRPGGFGLGLSEAADLLRRHGGNIRAQAAAGGGTEIEIRLRESGAPRPTSEIASRE